MDRKNNITLHFLMIFGVFFLVSLVLAFPYLWSKLALVRFFLQIWLGPVTPYVHPMPYYKGINLQYPFFCTLAWFTFPRVRWERLFWKYLLKMLAGVCILFLLDSLVTTLEIGSGKLAQPSNWLALFSLFSLSLGPVLYPVIVWFLLFLLPQRKHAVSSPRVKSKHLSSHP